MRKGIDWPGKGEREEKVREKQRDYETVIVYEMLYNIYIILYEAT